LHRLEEKLSKPALAIARWQSRRKGSLLSGAAIYRKSKKGGKRRSAARNSKNGEGITRTRADAKLLKKAACSHASDYPHTRGRRILNAAIFKMKLVRRL